MMRSVYLYGYLAEKYGEKFTLDVASIGEAIQALDANFGDFKESIRGGEFYVACGEEINEETNLAKEELPLIFEQGDFHIAPVIAGKKSGLLKAVVGVVLIAVAVVATIYTGPAGAGFFSALTSGWSGVAFSMGVSLTLSGVATMMAGNPQTPQVAPYRERERADARPSFIFDGAVNRTEQGGPVPVIYGEVITGSIVMSGSVRVEQMPYEGEAS